MTNLILGILLLASSLGLLIWTYKDKSSPNKHSFNYINNLKDYVWWVRSYSFEIK